MAGFSTDARAAGIDKPTLGLAFDNVHLVSSVIASDRAQPEFTRAVWDYLDSALSAQRIACGQEKLLQLRPMADTMAARYGVPAEVLVAI
jgi:membrane-bound lytic murein transglycosylase B